MSFNRNYNLEPHQAIWLGVPAYDITVDRLRQIVDYSEMFHDVDLCKQFLSKTLNTVTFLIWSDVVGSQRKLLDELLDMKNIHRIYIYHPVTDCDFGIEEGCDCRIKQCCKTPDDLLNELSQDVQRYLSQQDHQASRFDSSTTDFNKWWTLVVDILTHIHYRTSSRLELVTSLKQYYVGNAAEITKLDEFQRDYSPEKAVYWYTRNSCLYRILNHAFRQYDYKILFLFGFFMQDLYRQIKEEHEQFRLKHFNNPIVKLYRGQILHQDEIKTLLDRLAGHYSPVITNTSLFSTTANRQVARLFLNELLKPDSDEQNVLFEIEVDVRQEPTGYYADISHLSRFSEEEEILFMPGSYIFVDRFDISYSERENLWTIRLKTNRKFNPERSRNWDDCISMRTNLKNLITKLSYCTEPVRNYDDSMFDSSVGLWPELSEHITNTIFDSLMEIYPAEEWIDAVRFSCLVECNITAFGDPDLAETLYEQALGIWHNFEADDELQCTVDIAFVHESLGRWHARDSHHDGINPQYEVAVKYYELALSRAEASGYELSSVYDRLCDFYKFLIDEEAKRALQDQSFDPVRLDVSPFTETMDDERRTVPQNKELQRHYYSMVEKYSNLILGGIISSPTSDGRPIIYYSRKIAERYISLSTKIDALSCYTNALTAYKQVLQFLKKQPNPDLDRISYFYGKIVEIYTDESRINDKFTALGYQLECNQYLTTLNENELEDIEYIKDYKRRNEGRSLRGLGSIQILLHNYIGAIASFESALRAYYSQSNIDVYSVVEIYSEIVRLMTELSQCELALSFQLQKHEFILSQYTNQKDLMASSYVELGKFYQSRHRFDEAVINYEEATKLYPKHPKFLPIIIQLFDQIVEICHYLPQKLENALKYELLKHQYIVQHSKRTSYWEERVEIDTVASNYLKIADLYTSLNQREQAIRNYERAILIYQQEGKSGCAKRYETYEKLIQFYSKDRSSIIKYQLERHRELTENNHYLLDWNYKGRRDFTKRAMARSHFDLASSYIEIHELNSAMEHLNAARNLYIDVIAEFPNEQQKCILVEEKLAYIYLDSELTNRYELCVQHLTNANIQRLQLWKKTQLLHKEDVRYAKLTRYL